MSNESKTSQELKESEERFRLLAESSEEGIVLSENGSIVDLNDPFLKIFGFKERSEIIGKKLEELIHPDFHKLVNNKIQETNPESYEVKCIRKDGSIIIVKSKGRLIPYRGRTIRISVLTDITKQKKHEDGLLASEKRYRKLIENNLAAVFRTEVGGGLLETVSYTHLTLPTNREV